MEEVKMEQQTAADPRKNRYVVDIRRDKAMMMKYIKFYNRVKHPRVTFNLVMTGILLALVPTLVKNMALPGVIVCYGVGALLVADGTVPAVSGAWHDERGPGGEGNEELTYLFGNTGGAGWRGRTGLWTIWVTTRRSTGSGRMKRHTT